MWTYNSYLELIKEGLEKDVGFFFRHDVDISLKKAVEMAEFESKNGIKSTYYILLSSPYYNALEAENLQRIRTLRELGMGIGLHYDNSIKLQDANQCCSEIIIQLGMLQHHIGELEEKSVTFHKPLRGVDINEETVNLLNLSNIYSPNFDQRFKYISDSGHNWRENPYDIIDTNDMVHINTHPEWYNNEEMDMEDCIYSLGIEFECDKEVNKLVRSMREYRDRVL
tara:strand:- start:1101 stop:1775 length:675 start_codon:yes stop_codon:yes gene_type:complete